MGKNMTVTYDNVPADLAQLKTWLLDEGWTCTGATYTHPDAPGLRLNTAYAHREATLTVSTLPNIEKDKPVWRVVAYYRGSDPLKFMRQHVIQLNTKIFPSLADNSPSTP
jgi:hypothetical protein